MNTDPRILLPPISRTANLRSTDIVSIITIDKPSNHANNGNVNATFGLLVHLSGGEKCYTNTGELRIFDSLLILC